MGCAKREERDGSETRRLCSLHATLFCSTSWVRPLALACACIGLLGTLCRPNVPKLLGDRSCGGVGLQFLAETGSLDTRLFNLHCFRLGTACGSLHEKPGPRAEIFRGYVVLLARRDNAAWVGLFFVCNLAGRETGVGHPCRSTAQNICYACARLKYAAIFDPFLLRRFKLNVPPYFVLVIASKHLQFTQLGFQPVLLLTYEEVVPLFICLRGGGVFGTRPFGPISGPKALAYSKHNR